MGPSPFAWMLYISKTHVLYFVCDYTINLLKHMPYPFFPCIWTYGLEIDFWTNFGPILPNKILYRKKKRE